MNEPTNDIALSKLLSEGRIPNLTLEVDLVSAVPMDGIAGHTTANTILNWQSDSGNVLYRAQGIPVFVKESKENAVIFAASGGSPDLRFVIFLEGCLALIDPEDKTHAKPYRLKITVSRLEIGGIGYLGEIDSCVLTYEPRQGTLEVMF